MSDLPDRKEMFHRLPGLQHVDEVVVIEAYVRGVLKSRDEMNIQAMRDFLIEEISQVITAWLRGELKSRDEMDLEAAASTFDAIRPICAALSSHVMDPDKGLIAMQAALDVAWGRRHA